MTGWPVPDGAEGDPRLVRVFTSAVREGEQECPMHRALKAHPRIETTVPAFKSQDFEDFPLEPVMRALDLIEDGKAGVAETLDGLSRTASEAGRGRGQKRLHPGLVQWAAHAVTHYLEAALPAVKMPGVGQPALVPVRDEWVQQLDLGRLDESGVRMYELCAWGRRYQSPDGLFRELRLPRFGTVEGAEREPGEVAMAARVLAFGSPARVAEKKGTGAYDWPTRRGRPYLVQQGPLPSWVRVVEVGCGDGSARVLFEGDPDKAKREYEEARGRLRATVDAAERRPGRSCVSCRLAPTCLDLTKVPGLLGIADGTRPRRTLSVTDLRRHEKCPAQEHLRRLRLPRRLDIEYGSRAVQRGKAVHKLLEQLHARRPHRRCTLADIPDPRGWSAGEWHLTGREAELGAQMMARHVAVCPLKYADRDMPLSTEPVLAFDDPASDTVVIAEPDLLYWDGGGRVWRETKTTGYIADRSGKDVLEVYPQAALALVLLAEGALGGDPARSRVELEILRPTGPDLELINAGDPGRVAKAREVIASLAGPWHSDREFTANPEKRRCADCEVARWCPSALPAPPDEGDAGPGGQQDAPPAPSAQSAAA
ncbi:MAG TPA: PD-(D/E)XK nuclease family protein [Streptosporangiaceae bacterium]|nr:PD-(D/E)XK nuclease family protein [Streptosporangiaceae bacterium]